MIRRIFVYGIIPLHWPYGRMNSTPQPHPNTIQIFTQQLLHQGSFRNAAPLFLYGRIGMDTINSNNNSFSVTMTSHENTPNDLAPMRMGIVLFS